MTVRPTPRSTPNRAPRSAPRRSTAHGGARPPAPRHPADPVPGAARRRRTAPPRAPRWDAPDQLRTLVRERVDLLRDQLERVAAPDSTGLQALRDRLDVIERRAERGGDVHEMLATHEELAAHAYRLGILVRRHRDRVQSLGS